MSNKPKQKCWTTRRHDSDDVGSRPRQHQITEQRGHSRRYIRQRRRHRQIIPAESDLVIFHYLIQADGAEADTHKMYGEIYSTLVYRQVLLPLAPVWKIPAPEYLTITEPLRFGIFQLLSIFPIGRMEHAAGQLPAVRLTLSVKLLQLIQHNTTGRSSQVLSWVRPMEIRRSRSTQGQSQTPSHLFFCTLRRFAGWTRQKEEKQGPRPVSCPVIWPHQQLVVLHNAQNIRWRHGSIRQESKEVTLRAIGSHNSNSCRPDVG